MVSHRGRSVGLSRAIGFVFVVQQVALVGACSKGHPVDSPPAAPSGSQVVKAALNASPRTGDFIFEAANSIVLHSAPLTVNGGDVGARGTGSGPFLSGGVAIDISSGAVVQTTHNVIADSIKLNTGVSVGDLQVNRLVNPSSGTHGSVTPLVPLPALPVPAAVIPGTTNLTVAGGKTVTASPGQFLTVSLGTSAVLRLNPGVYQMKDLTIGTSGRIEALGAVQIRVANRLNAGSSFSIGPASGTTLTAKDIRIEVSGINGTNGALGSTPKAAALGSNGNIRALVLVPNGTLTLATGICAKGAFLARDIDVGSSNAAYVFEDGFPNAGTCTPAGCDDHNACTTDGCAADGTCTHTNVAAGASCSDGNACNGAETCNASGACQAGTPVTCTASDACHLAGTCNPATGACSNPSAPAGTSCGDGNACNGAETCNASGACQAGTPVTCVAADACHLAGTCNPATGACSNPSAPPGTSCGDGNACNGAEVCNGAGLCTPGTPVTCVATDACHLTGTCNPATGACSNPSAPVGTSCTDGNACNGAETCDGAGACRNGTPVTCTASDQCHTPGVCNPTTGSCSNPAKPDGTACNDTNACTQTDTCQGGSCNGANPVTCTAQDECHDVGTCASDSGQCSNPLKPAGTPCGSGNTCSATGECVSDNQAPVVNAGPDQNVDMQQPKPSPNFTLQRLSTLFNTPVGIEYHPILDRMVMSVNCCNGQPFTFESVKPDGTHEPYTTINGLGDEVYFAIARDEGGGFSIGGFPAGQMFTGNGQAGHITRISPDGSTIENPWIILPGEPGLMRGQLQFDRTGVFNGDLIVSTTAGHIWRVTPAGDATMVADLHLGGDWEGLTTVPNDPLRYGPWAGKILTGDENRDGIYAVDATGDVTLFPLLMRPENIHVIPAGENFFGVDYFGGALYGASASQFKDMVGDILVTEEFTGDVWHVRWNGTDFESTLLARVVLWEHTAFGPPALAEIVPAEMEVALSGTATDDGRPPGSTLSSTWSLVSGPAPVTFANVNSPSTTAKFIDVGTYVLALTATDGTLTTTDQVTINIRRITPHNDPPVVNAGPDQTVRVPDVAVMAGTVNDDGLPVGNALDLSWSMVSGPLTPQFLNSKSGFTPVLFFQSGIYVLQLDASDGELSSSDQVTINVSPEPPLNAASLTLTLANAGPLTTGTAEGATAVLLDASATPISQFPVTVTVTGANPRTLKGVTDATGVAHFAYVGNSPGTDDLHATAAGQFSSVDSATVSVAWTDVPIGGPVLTQGWIASPTHQSAVTTQVPVILSPDVALTGPWTVLYWPINHPDQLHTLKTGTDAGAGATLATFDTTVLANDTYVLHLDGTRTDGTQRSSEVAVVVSGDYKPGRVVVELTDFTVPINGMPITIGRRYDSLEKDSVGDFGHGWSLMIGHPRLEVDPSYNVTVTMPGGRRATFLFTLTPGPLFFNFLLFPGYKPAPGVFGTFTSDGCDLLTISSGRLVCFLGDQGLDYAPTKYTYTDPYGVAYEMGSAGELRSIKDALGDSLTFQPDGIVSSTGKSVAFTRDTEGRILYVDYAPVFNGTGQHSVIYGYDPNGDLESVELPPSGNAPSITHHFYEQHRLTKTVDGRGYAVRTSEYDPASGRLTKDTDALGNETSYTYDLATRTHTKTNPLEGGVRGVVTQVFDASGLLLSEKDPLGFTTTHEYDADQNETATTNAVGQRTTATFDSHGNKTSTTDALNRTTTTTYTTFNLPSAVLDPLGHTVTNEYDDRHLVARIADEIGTRATFENSDHGQPLTITDAEGKHETRAYDIAGNLTQKTDRIGRITKATWDELGRKLTATAAGGNVTTNTYLRQGWLNTTYDSYGYGTQNAYDANGNIYYSYDFPTVHGQTNPTFDALNHLTQLWRVHDGTFVNFTRDFRGNPTSVTDENGPGHTTTHEYDLNGRLIKSTFADGSFTKRKRDGLGRIIESTDENGHTTTFEYDPACACSDRVTKVTDHLGRSTKATYDALGRRTSITDGEGNRTDITYNVRNQITDIHFADGTSTHGEFDSRGRRISTRDQTGATTLYGYDDVGQLTSVTDPLGNVTSYAYDPDGNLASVTDANGRKTSYTYDLVKRKKSRKLPTNQTESFDYNGAGNLIGHTDFQGRTTTMTYDHRDQMLAKIPDPSTLEPAQIYTYSPSEKRKSMTDASGATNYDYDVRDRLAGKAAPAGTLTYAYDLAGNLATVRATHDNGASFDYDVAYGWDEANQLSTVTDNLTHKSTVATYTKTRKTHTLTQPNGVIATYEYDAIDRTHAVGWGPAGGSLVASWNYTYNGRGQALTSEDITGRKAAYEYDADGWLKKETVSGAPVGGNGTIDYLLDGAGNRLSQTSTLPAIPSATYAYNGSNQLTADSYDPNGNTTASRGNTFAYDFENHMVSKNGGAVSVVYDGDGNRVAKTVGGVTTQYLVDDLNPTGYLQVLEEISGGVVKVRYTYGKSIISQTRDPAGTPTTSYYGSDGHGNITFLTDATGAVTDSYDYDAWGVLVDHTGSTPNTRRYAGEELDPDLGLIALRARLYDPERGRFTTLDPIMGKVEYPVTLNGYLYGNGDPVNQLDPTGLRPIAPFSSFDEWNMVALALTVVNAVLAVIAGYLAYWYMTHDRPAAAVLATLAFSSAVAGVWAGLNNNPIGAALGTAGAFFFLFMAITTEIPAPHCTVPGACA